ncbi:hypothetical protein [Streptomyces sp. 5-6(2022)]|uniref:hypothetical protein n=1 Tax=Streptomyces sp. 5-6(2022) TaxID=2936510 RepID=UPI0023B94E9F|nr:hypothetical protein [Streptomyces sp. 5-6(2022)]
MSDHDDKITEAQVQERAAQIRERLNRVRKIEGFDPVAGLDVEAMARRSLEARARPKPSAHDVLKAIRPEWEKEAAQQGLTGEALSAFKRQILAEDGPQVYAEMTDIIYYVIHLNKAAVEKIDSDSEIVFQALEVATLALPEIDDIISPLEAFIRAEVTTIQAVGSTVSNGQVQLVGVWPVPVVIAESDEDYNWDAEDAAKRLGDIIGG